MKVSYIHGVCVRNDAISNAIRDEIGWLECEGHHDVQLYGYVCDHANIPFTRANEIRDVAFDSHFQSSDLVVFHYGVFYPLFDLLAIVPNNAKRLVVFHNITPKEFVSAEHHLTIEQSFQQMANMVFADHVVCDSQTNLDTLRTAGIRTAASVLSLAIQTDSRPPDLKPSRLDGLVRIAFIGRFVRSKGPHDLLAAVEKALQVDKNLRLVIDMIGNLTFSDSSLIEEIYSHVDKLHRVYRNRVVVNIHGNAGDDVKLQILSNADLFVLPTYHEGFCVPVMEAMAMGCRIISYQNSNIPAISGGFGNLTPTGDITVLSCALLEESKIVTSSDWHGSSSGSYSAYLQRVQKYVRQYFPDKTKDRFLDLIGSLVD